MRIIAGKYKGQSLKNSKTPNCRPTQDRVKESLFSILQNELKDSVVLDLFAGSGALGIEALSRGAAHVTFVEKDIKLLRENLSKLDPNFTVIKEDARRFLKKTKKRYDIIFVDPPYHEEALYESALAMIQSQEILSDGGIVVVESLKKMDLVLPEGMREERVERYGSTKLSFLNF